MSSFNKYTFIVCLLFFGVYLSYFFKRFNSEFESTFDFKDVKVLHEFDLSHPISFPDRNTVSINDTSLFPYFSRKDSLSGLNDYVTYLELYGPVSAEPIRLHVGSVFIHNHQLNLKQLNWLSKKGADSLVINNIKLVDYERQKNVKANKTVCLIGGNHTLIGQGQHLRKEWAAINENIAFIGSKKDVFGYRHEGQSAALTQDIINRLKVVPKADVYVVFAGEYEILLPKDSLAHQFDEICNVLQGKNRQSKIIIVSIPPMFQDYYTVGVNQTNKDLLGYAWNENVHFLAIDYGLDNENDLKKVCISKDKFSLTEYAYSKIISQLNNCVNGL